ncbi:NAD(P)/FAD-dependent oxidoreductase [Alkalibacterium sp.]|nr:MAG: FAD-binding oxidoreductase [Alkalibacterium sp.]
MTKKVAIIGAGVVGASAAYLLSKEDDIDLTVYDEGTGQGTSAAAGIISPWLSRRRNKKWYHMVREGAAYYPVFLSDVMEGEAIPSSVYKQVGTLLFKKKEAYIHEMFAIGEKRKIDAPEIGELAILSPDEIREKVPLYSGENSAVWASGGARVDGGKLVELLLSKAEKNGAKVVRQHVAFNTVKGSHQYAIQTEQSTEQFESVILTASAWLPDILTPLDYAVDVRPQKGQLAEVKLAEFDTQDWPVMMPEGESDIIPFEDGRVIIGATHEDDKGFNLTIDEDMLDDMVQKGTTIFTEELRSAPITQYRSGTRAYTSDYAPFFGEVPELPNVYAASGLGSTGLTAGPLVGKCLAESVLGLPSTLNEADYPIWNYVKKKSRDNC